MKRTRTVDRRYQNWSRRHGHNDVSHVLVNAGPRREQAHREPAVPTNASRFARASVDTIVQMDEAPSV